MTSKQKKDHGKKPWLILVLLSLFFYGAMLLLTGFADDIHNARLPQVTTGQLGKQNFTQTLTLKDGTTIERTRSCTALPKELVDSGRVFTVRSVTENGFTYYYARKLSCTIDTNLQHDDYYAIAGSPVFRDSIILTGYEDLKDGDEVFLVKEEQKTSEELTNENLFQ